MGNSLASYLLRGPPYETSLIEAMRPDSRWIRCRAKRSASAALCVTYTVEYPIRLLA
jgi:hypothetical protein